MPKNAVFINSLLGFATQSDITILDSRLIPDIVTGVFLLLLHLI